MNKFVISVVVASVCFMSDRIHKLVMLDFYQISQFEKWYVTPFFDWVLVWNKGISYGLLTQDSDVGQIIIAIIAIIIAVGLLFFATTRKGAGEVMALGMIAGGAISNAIDRFAYGAVADFISFHIGNFYWYVFNIADVWIVVGATFYVLSNLFKSKRRQLD